VVESSGESGCVPVLASGAAVKRIIGYALAVVLGGGFWTWVAAATATGIVHAWWRHLTDVGPPRHMIHAVTGPQPSSPADAARVNAGAEYPIRIEKR
jgi:hypothetical protein